MYDLQVVFFTKQENISHNWNLDVMNMHYQPMYLLNIPFQPLEW
jgi:CRISPR/Cas system CMR subunit Cmr6 (Cas7 group RAMP superfamily)